MKNFKVTYLIRTGGSIDQVYDTPTETIGFNPDFSPVVKTLESIVAGKTNHIIKDHRISGVNSSDLTDRHLEELMDHLRGRLSAHSRIIITSGTGAVSRIAKTIKDSRFLTRTNNEYFSTPSIIQVATKLPGFLGEKGDITSSLRLAYSTLHFLEPANHVVVCNDELVTRDDALSGQHPAFNLLEKEKVIY